MIQAREADMWGETPVADQANLERQGFVRQTGRGAYLTQILINTKDPNTPWQNKKVREALEYALNKIGSYNPPPELLRLSEESLRYDGESEQREITNKIARYMTDQALTVPIYTQFNAYMVQPWVHTDYLRQSLGRWRVFDTWVDKH